MQSITFKCFAELFLNIPSSIKIYVTVLFLSLSENGAKPYLFQLSNFIWREHSSETHLPNIKMQLWIGTHIKYIVFLRPDRLLSPHLWGISERTWIHAVGALFEADPLHSIPGKLLIQLRNVLPDPKGFFFNPSCDDFNMMLCCYSDIHTIVAYSTKEE